MPQVKVLVLTGYGTNCERETAYICRIAGADQVSVAHFADLVQETIRLTDFNFLIFPGGFLDGDHLGAAQAAAARFKHTSTRSGHSLVQEISDLHARGGLIMGICNGFQLLVKLGLLPATRSRYLHREVSLGHNDSARFEDRWVSLQPNLNSSCVFTQGLGNLYFPVRHGEGKLIVKDESILEEIKKGDHIALRYTDSSGAPTQEYPDNPNGSQEAIAGLSDPTGRIFGLMPHPEAYNHKTNHPRWPRGEQSASGTTLFARGIDFLRSNLST
ncbi:MAG: phosphoribosylformylglycinamidine synthase subunit PurQ [Desulfovermiculus sp.]|nr:phosphoribosylformylglycinamidine synthase subunit PurQ [Desulfovermiculus sp.]